MTESHGVGSRPNACLAAVESMTKSPLNWYSVSLSSRISGEATPSPYSTAAGRVLTGTGLDPGGSRDAVDSLPFGATPEDAAHCRALYAG
jgi:hypothetical protein